MSIASVKIEPISNILGWSCAFDADMPANLAHPASVEHANVDDAVHTNSVLEIPNATCGPEPTPLRARKETEPGR